MTQRRSIVLLLAATALIYANALRNDFTQDDFFYIADNPQVRHEPWMQLVQPHANSNVYRPVTFISYSLNYFVAGMRPWAYHAVNIVLHCSVVLLFYWLLQAMLGSSLVPLAAAWLFALHPIHTEAVTAAVGRAELLAAVFVLAAWLLHLRDREIPALVCFALALGSKESGVAFLVLAPAGDYALGRWKPAARYAKMGALAVFYLVWLWNVQGGRFGQQLIAQMDNPLAALPAQWRILNAICVAWKYVALQIYPATLSCDYSFAAIPVSYNVPLLALAAAGVLAVIAACGWAVSRRQTGLIVAGAIYFSGFAVTSNILFPTGTIMGERLAYLPSAGLCLLAAIGWEHLRAREHKLSIAILVIAGGLLAGRTVQRNFDWRNNMTLYQAAVRAVPGSAKMHSNLGNQYLDRKDFDRARAEFDASMRIYPDYSDMLAAYGLLEWWTGHKDRAGFLMDRALGISGRDNPNFDLTATNYAALLLETGRTEAALNILNDVIAHSPRYARAFANRAVILYRAGACDAARRDAEAALQLDPANTQAQGVWRLCVAPQVRPTQ